MGDSKTIAGMDYQFAEHIKTLQKYNDTLALVPDKHRMMMKFLGPMYDSYMKLSFGLESVKRTFGGAGKEGEKATTGMAKGGEKANKTLGLMVGTVGALGAVFTPLVKVLSMTKGLFMGIIGTLMPFLGIIFAVIAVVMLLVAIFDQGGGSLRAWLEDLPLVGDAFKAVDGAVGKVKTALGAVDWEGIKGSIGGVATSAGDAFGPTWDALVGGLGDTLESQKTRILATWQNLKDNVTFPDMEGIGGIFTAIADSLTVTVEIFFGFYNLVYDLIFAFINEIIAMGFVQIWVDGIGAIWTAIEGAWNDITGAFDDTGVTIDDFFGAIMDVFNYVMDFLKSSGIFSYYMEFQTMMFELIGFIIFIVGKVVAIVIRFIVWVYPYVVPYYRMVINALGLVLTPVFLVMKTVVRVIRVIMALLMGNTDKAKQLWGGIVDMWGEGWTKMKGFAAKAVNALIDFTTPLWKGINAGINLANKIPGVNISKVNYQSWKFAKGGVAQGPKSGYPVELHGTEAIVPLPDGRSIPVTIKNMGGGGGGPTNITINVSGATGDGRKLARQISEEVSRAFRSTSRGSGLSRGM